jgi:lipopolysaccharide export system permease protein
VHHLDRYIFKAVVGPTLVTLLVLLALETLIGLLEELDNLRGGYDLTTIFHYIALTLPRRAHEVFPVALLLGGLLGMGQLSSGSEVVAMRVAGISVLRLVWPVLWAGLLLNIGALLLGEFVAPHSERLAQNLRANARAEAVTIRMGQGFWARDGNYFIHVNGVLPGFRLADIHLYEVATDDSRLTSIAWAQQAHYDKGTWILDRVSRNAIQDDAVTTEQLTKLRLNLGINPDLLEVLAIEPEDLSMRDLYKYISYLQSNGLDARQQQFAWWTKVFAPLANLAILYLAMPFVFAPQRTLTRGKRLMIGICLGLLFFLVNRLIGNVVLLYSHSPLLGAILPALLFATAGTYALRRVP